MKLMTPILLNSPKAPFSYGSHFFNIGSCFANNLAVKLKYSGFSVHQNPIGILFHPYAIQQFCQWLDGEAIDKDLFVENQGVWKSFQAHSQMQAETSAELSIALQKAVENTRHFLAKTDVVFITFGTAFAYQHLSSNKFVANCQKQKASLFEKVLVSPEDVLASIQKSISIISKLTAAQIYVSVSPVRHLKDGLIENNRSKAHLLAAVHQVVSQFERLHYFPAYEIVMDELRDYRYYDRDLLHPNPLAVDYIWEKCCASFFDEATLQTMQKVAKYRRLSAHRPIQKNAKLAAKHAAKVAAAQQELLAIEPRLQLDQ